MDALMHYGQSRVVCDVRVDIDTKITDAIEWTTCPDCLILVLKDVDETVQGWYDRDKSEYVTEPFTDGVSLFMERSTQTRARGVAQGQSGTLYLWTIRRPGQGDPICIRDRDTRFLMEPWKTGTQTLVSLAERLWEFEWRYAAGHEMLAFNQELRNAKHREMQAAAATLPTIIPESI